MKKCPFRNFKKCSEECMLHRRGLRYTDESRTKSEAFEACAINIMTDNIEVMSGKIFQSQKETGDMKNVLAMKMLFDMGLKEENEVKRVISNTLRTDETKIKLLKE